MVTVKQALIVEENGDVAAELESLLGGLGYKVTRMDNAEEVLSKLQSRKYDVAFMNMAFPGMSWRKTIQTVKNMARTTTIIFIRQSPEEDDVRLALSSGAYVVLYRPISQQQLANLLSIRSDGLFVALKG